VTTPVADITHLTDAQLAAANQQDGLGLALRIAGDSYQTGKPIPLHLVVEDLAAREPIAAGMCTGFFIAYEDAATHESSRSQLSTNRGCFDTDPYPDTIPLEKGKLKTIDITTEAATNFVLPPANYLIHIEWQSYPAGAGTVAAPVTYSTLESNIVPITVTP
jgi:hypothetical protein